MECLRQADQGKKGLLAMRSGTIKFEDLVCMENPRDVLEEVKTILLLIFPDFDSRALKKTFDDTLRLFRGEYPGYRRCDTHYHDLKHTTDCLMAMTRLIHGLAVNGIRINEADVTLGLISSLMHDTGYILTLEDSARNGAVYTLTHVERGIAFMEKYFIENGIPEKCFYVCRNHLRCTDLDIKPGEIRFESREHELLGKALGTADILGQMADRTYIEKLPFLYMEFKEGGVPGFEDEFDFLRKTPRFLEFVKQRFTCDLGNMDRFMRDHFMVRWGIDRDLYREAIETNISYLHFILENHGRDYGKHLGSGPYQEKLGSYKDLQDSSSGGSKAAVHR